MPLDPVELQIADAAAVEASIAWIEGGPDAMAASIASAWRRSHAYVQGRDGVSVLHVTVDALMARASKAAPRLSATRAGRALLMRAIEAAARYKNANPPQPQPQTINITITLPEATRRRRVVQRDEQGRVVAIVDAQ